MKPDSTLDPTIHTFLPSGVAKLEHLGIIRVTGVDAASFLQGQLTNDVVLQKLEESRLAAFCNAKGRMQASFIVYKRPALDITQTTSDIYLICSRDILPQTLKRLSMFVMRAKAKLTDVSAEFNIFGLTGSAIFSIATEAINTPATAIFNTSTIIALRPAIGQSRALYISPIDDAAPVGDVLSNELWNWGEVQAGIATITAPVVEAFVPQMLNYESVGGVNFKKGCYPGQEVVARSQFRGTLKRRAYVVQIDDSNTDTSSQPLVGQEVFHESDAEQPCGTVVQVAKNPEVNPTNYPQTGYSAIVSMQVSASAGGKLTLGSANGASISLLPLPYPLLEDI
jgi:tRNA-modifying protein YgfZ